MEVLTKKLTTHELDDPIETYIRGLKLNTKAKSKSNIKQRKIQPIKEWPYKLVFHPTKMVFANLDEYLSYKIKWDLGKKKV